MTGPQQAPPASPPPPTSPPISQRTLRPAATIRSGRWVVKRALIGLLLLTLFAAGTSTLMYATIEPDVPSTSGE